MVTSSDSYGNSTGIERLIGDLWVSRTLSSTTIPTSDQVDLAIDDIGSELNIHLSGAGYTVPVSTGSDPITHRWLESMNNQGAAANVLGMIPMTAIAPISEDAGSNRMQMYIGFYNRGLTMIDEQKIRSARINERVAIVFTGSQTDSNRDRKLPRFTRGMDDTPSLKRLTD